MLEDKYDSIKNSIANIRCINLKTGKLISIGTGYLIAENLVMTARHNIECYIDNKLEILVELTFKCNLTDDKRITARINKITYGEEIDEYDIVILELENSIKTLIPLQFSKFHDINTSTIRKLDWTTYGFPVIQSPYNIRTFEGYILDNSKVEKWDLNLRWNGNEQISSDGLSGAPLLIGGRVVGMLTTELSIKLGAALGAVSTIKFEQILKDNNIEVTEIEYKKDSYEEQIIIKNKCYGILPENKKFVGRKDQLLKLELSITQNDLIVLTGLGGVGKTQIVNEYVHKHKNEYDIICWLNSEDEKTIETEYIRFAKELNISIDKEPVSARDISSQVNKRLDGTNVIYIFDNAKRSNELLQHIAAGHKGIITSRKSEWTGCSDDCIKIDGFERDESIEFILKRIGVQDKKNANLLSEELGDYPLALEQATAYICNKQSMSIEQYLERYKMLKAKNEVDLERKLFSKDDILRYYKKTLRNTLRVTIDELAFESPQSIYLLNMCSFLSPEIIPLEIFNNNKELLCQEITEFQNYGEDFELEFEDEVIDPLIKYSLINWNIEQKGFQIHRMVQQITRVNIIESSQQKPFINMIIKIIENSFSYDPHTVNTWTKCDTLLPHALFIISKSIEWHDEENTENLLNILETSINYLRNMLIPGKLEDILEMLDKLIGTNEEKYALYRIEYFYYYGCVYETTGKYIDAIEVLNKGLELSIKHKEELHELSILNKIGDMHLSINKYEQALYYFQDVLNRSENIIIKGSIDYAVLLVNIGASYKGLKELGKAKGYFEECIKICENPQEPNLTEKCRALNYLGLVLYEMKKYNESIVKLKEAYNIAKEIYGESHNKVAIYLNNIGYSYDAMKIINEAKEYYEKAFETFNINDEFVTKDRSANLRNLATIYNNPIDYEKAIELYKKSIEMDRLIFGDYSRDVLDGYLGLGLAYLYKNDKANILESFKYIIDGLKTNSNLETSEIYDIAIIGSNFLESLGFFDYALKLKDIACQVHSIKKAKSDRNDPCPCGSGKKYKKCCME
jgi:tetratricopeptide (TPR) repeat protein